MAEILLALAIPFVMIQGYHTLLDSRAGTFIEEPTRADPGWTALVTPTEVIGVAEVDRGVVTGVTLVVHNPGTAAAGGVVLVPGTLELDGEPLTARAPGEAVLAVTEALRLGVTRIDVLDEQGWVDLLGDASYGLENPDPVPASDDEGRVDGEAGVLLAVGPVEVGAAEAGAFVGRPANGAVAVSVLPRRHLLWSALLAEPPTTGGALAADLAAIDRLESSVLDLPVTQLEPAALLDPVGAEVLVRDLVAFPTGAAPGDRLRVRLVDRTGRADLEDIAAGVAAQGIEVIEIGNAAAFDDGPTEVVTPVGVATAAGAIAGEVEQLARAIGVAEIVVDAEPVEEEVVTVLIGADFDLMTLY